MLTEKDYCDYETAFGLIALGYPGSALVLLYSAQKWLREEKGIHITINYVCLDEDIFMYTLRHIGKKLREGGGLYNNKQYSSCEEALSEGIKEAVKILKENGKDYQV